jgi:hypothetical protein
MSFCGTHSCSGYFRANWGIYFQSVPSEESSSADAPWPVKYCNIKGVNWLIIEESIPNWLNAEFTPSLLSVNELRPGIELCKLDIPGTSEDSSVACSVGSDEDASARSDPTPPVAWVGVTFRALVNELTIGEVVLVDVELLLAALVASLLMALVSIAESASFILLKLKVA